MDATNADKIRKCEHRRLTLVAEVEAKRAPVQGWVEAVGVKLIRLNKGKVEVFCPHHQTPKTVYYERRLFLAEALQLASGGNGQATPKQPQPDGSPKVIIGKHKGHRDKKGANQHVR